MSYHKRKYLTGTLSLLLVCTLMASSILNVWGAGEEDQKNASALEQELSGLDQDLKNLELEITAITEEISDMTARTLQVQEELAKAKGEEALQYESMKKRIKYMYENGNTGLLEILISSSSIADFLNRVEYVSMVNEYDRSALKKLEKTRQDIADKEALLTKEQEDLAAYQTGLKEKEASLTSQISATSEELAACQARIKKAQEEAAKTQEALSTPVTPILPETTEEDEKTSSGNNTSSDSDSDYSATASDIELFAALIECEAGSSDYESMLAVASVVVNRMNHKNYPNTLRGVIYQSGQFSPAHNGKLDRVLKRGVKSSCITVANDALAGKNNVGDCLSFRSAGSGHTGIVIGGNVFF